MPIKQIKNNNSIFIAILIAFIGCFICIAGLLLYLSYTSNIVLYKMILNIILLLVFSFCLYLFISIIIFIQLLKGKRLNKIQKKWVQNSLTFLYPQILYITQLLGLDKDRIRSVFSEINNRLILTDVICVKPEEVLILLPHCLQNSSCPHKITSDINNCKKCGKCDINSLIHISERYKTQVYVATGGTLARKIVRDIQPKIIIAVACERDLSSGIMDIKNIPVIGILIERPEGPCVNTKVDSVKIQKVIQYIIGEEGKLCSSIHLITDSDRG